MLNVEEKDSIFFQRPMDFFKNGVQVLDIVQSQIGDHAVPCILWIRIFLDPAHLIADARPAVAPPGFLDHLPAQINAQHLPGALLHGELTMPSIAAAQIQYRLSLQRREKGLELMPLACRGKPFPAAGHLGILLEKSFVFIFISHGVFLLPAAFL